METTKNRTTLIILLIIWLILPMGSTAFHSIDERDLTPCEITEEMVGQIVLATGQIGFVDHNDPEGLYADLEEGACHVGLWIGNHIWDEWDAAEQALLTTGNWLTVEGRIQSFQGNLIIEILGDPPVPAEESMIPETQGSSTTGVQNQAGNFGMIPEIGDFPQRYQLDVPQVYSGHNGYPAMCYLGAFAMVAMYHNPALIFSDMIAFSGLGSSAQYLEPPGMDPFINNRYWESGLVFAAQNMKSDIIVGTALGGYLYDMANPASIPIDEETAMIYSFENGNQALAYLKQTIAMGLPVVVHLDIYYVYEDFSAQSDHWRTGVGHDHASHYMTVIGYDLETITLKDPTDPSEETQILTTTTQHFQQAWENTLEIPNTPPIGPYWMLYIDQIGQIPAAEDIVAWNVLIGQTSPAAFRDFASNPGDDFFVRFNLNELAKGRLDYADYLQQHGYTEAATLYRQAGEILSAMVLEDDIKIEDLYIIADLEEEALMLLNK